MADQKISIVIAARNMVASGFSGVVGAAKNLRAKIGASLAGVANIAKRVAASIGIIGAAAVAVTKKFVDAYQADEQAGAKLSATLRATGYAAGFTTNELKKYAAELQKTVGIGDEVSISMMGILASFKNIRGDTFKQATAAIIDMAANLGKAGKGSADVEAAVIQVGKALNDPIRGMAALGRVGIVFTGQQRKQITALQESGDLLSAQAIILSELQNEFGGVAKAMYDADSGTKRLSNSWGDFQEAIGKAIVENAKIKESLGDVAKILEDAVDSGRIELFGEKLAAVLRESGRAGKTLWESMKGIWEVLKLPEQLLSGKIEDSEAYKKLVGVATGKGYEEDPRLDAIRKRREEIEKEADENERLGMIDAKVDNYSADAQARLVAVMEQKQKQIKEHAKAAKERDAEIKKAEEEEKKRDEEAAEAKKKFWEKIEAIYDARVEKVKELVDKEKELAKDLTDEEKRLARETANEKKRLLDEQLAKTKEVAEKTIREYIKERRNKKAAEEDDRKQMEEGAKLAAKQRRGVRLSRRDQEKLDALRDIAQAREALPNLKGAVDKAQAQIDAINKSSRTLDDIRNDLQKNQETLNQLLKMG